MTRFYIHTDRRGSLQAGQVIDLSNDAATIGQYNTDRAQFLSALFPNGISEHGERYLFQQQRDTSGMIEALAEWIRQAKYPHLPSRLQSFFAWRTLEDARRFGQSRALRDAAGSPIVSIIWEVESQAAIFESDMNRLHLGECWLDAFLWVDAYWRQDYTPRPLIEVLLELPVRVIRKVSS